MSEPVNNSRSGAGSTSALNERSSSEKQPPPRWAMVADLGRCVGCQTCTAACKHTNATAPGVQWRKVLDFEVGEFPHVQRAFVPVGCMHCDDPPCMDVCPSRATKKRGDGLVTIDYDICIGCAYCAVACPFQARWRVDKPNAAYGTTSMRHETMREHPERRSVAQKCTFCVDRIDGGLAKGLTPGMDHEATPACVNSCIADALHFGDINDSTSNVSKLLAGNEHFRMHEEIGTGPNFFYLWKRKSANDGGEADLPVSEKPSTNMAAPMVAEPDGMNSVSPQLQTSWDWRAAANFIGGGTGTGLFAVASIGVIFSQMSLSPFEGANLTALVAVSLLALALVGMGLFCVWLEIGRPWRFLNVFLHAKLSWMTREAIAAIGFFCACGHGIDDIIGNFLDCGGGDRNGVFILSGAHFEGSQRHTGLATIRNCLADCCDRIDRRFGFVCCNSRIGWFGRGWFYQPWFADTGVVAICGLAILSKIAGSERRADKNFQGVG